MIISIVATILVSRYYFRRSTKRELSAYRLLQSQVFAGIEPEMRKRLRFTFEDQEVAELSQLAFLIANTGERGIGGFLEPPSITLPQGAKVLDTVLEHRYPETLDVSVMLEGEVTSGQRVSFRLPLLNKGEYFVVRLLIGGAVSLNTLRLKLLAEDLPREIDFSFLPPLATRLQRPGVDWSAVRVGGTTMALGLCTLYALWLLSGGNPSTRIFVVPSLTPLWPSFEISLKSIAIVFAIVGALLWVVIGALLSIGPGLSEAFSRGPRFPLPEHIGRGYFHGRVRLPIELIEGLTAAEADAIISRSPPSTKGPRS